VSYHYASDKPCPRRWIGWRTKGPTFPLEVIIFKRRETNVRRADNEKDHEKETAHDPAELGLSRLR
jgi:hypothetical protein